MKLGIITFHHVINYGSALQAYAMQEGIAKLGIDTEIIDYRPQIDSIFIRLRKNWKRLLDIEKWKRYLNRKIKAKKIYCNSSKYIEGRTKAFTEFHKKYFRLSSEITDRKLLKVIEKDYDAFVCGSDQIWNPTYIGHDMTYFLDFVSDDKKRCTYAPSIAVLEYPKEYEREIKEQMSRFQNISVREEESVEIVEKLTGKKPTVVVDPTLLLDAHEWHEVEKKPKKCYTEKPYIFCYFLGANKQYCEYVDYLKELTGLKIVLVTCTDMKVFENYGDMIGEDIGPSEFIYLIHHAEYVCTDSFHGTVFSIINERKFFTFRRYQNTSKSSENSRIYTLLNMIGHSERLVDSKMGIKELYQSKIDYDTVKRKIDICREESVKFLNHDLQRFKF